MIGIYSFSGYDKSIEKIVEEKNLIPLCSIIIIQILWGFSFHVPFRKVEPLIGLNGTTALWPKPTSLCSFSEILPTPY